MSTAQRLTRQEWIDCVVKEISTGDSNGDFSKQIAEAMAECYYDGPIADGCEPDSPVNAVWEEMQSGT